MAPQPPDDQINGPHPWPRSEDPDLKSDVRLLKYQVEQLSAKLDLFFNEVKNSYATKNDLQAVKDDVKSVKDSIAFIVKIIIGAVAAAVLGTVIIKGGNPLH